VFPDNITCSTVYMMPDQSHDLSASAQEHGGSSVAISSEGMGVSLAYPQWNPSVGGFRCGGRRRSRDGPLCGDTAPCSVADAFVYVPAASTSRVVAEGGREGLRAEPHMQAAGAVKQQIQVISGLVRSRTGGKDGPGDTRGPAHVLQAFGKKTRRATSCGRSIDQVAAHQIGTSPGSLLELAATPCGIGQLRFGYSCAYSSTCPGRHATCPGARAQSPPRFERSSARLAGDAVRTSARQEQQRSILDFVLDDTGALQRELGRPISRNLGNSCQRWEIERRISRPSDSVTFPRPAARPPPAPASFSTVQSMYDLLFWPSDRFHPVATFLLANEGATGPSPISRSGRGHHNCRSSREEGHLEKIAQMTCGTCGIRPLPGAAGRGEGHRREFLPIFG